MVELEMKCVTILLCPMRNELVEVHLNCDDCKYCKELNYDSGIVDCDYRPNEDIISVSIYKPITDEGIGLLKYLQEHPELHYKMSIEGFTLTGKGYDHITHLDSIRVKKEHEEKVLEYINERCLKL